MSRPSAIAPLRWAGGEENSSANYRNDYTANAFITSLLPISSSTGDLLVYLHGEEKGAAEDPVGRGSELRAALSLPPRSAPLLRPQRGAFPRSQSLRPQRELHASAKRNSAAINKQTPRPGRTATPRDGPAAHRPLRWSGEERRDGPKEGGGGEETATSLGTVPSAQAQREGGGCCSRTAPARLSPSGRERLPGALLEPCGSAAAAAGRAPGGRSPAGTPQCARVALLREEIRSTRLGGVSVKG